MTLFVVATPIGNLEDITERAIRTLKEADLIAAEDTRQTKKLLQKYAITTPLRALHQHSRPGQIERITRELLDGKNIALVSDAGTPNLADPGGQLVAAARKHNIPVVPLPGASAVTTIISVAGIPMDSFMFVGWLPKKRGRVSLWRELQQLEVPVILFESPHRVNKTLREIKDHLGNRRLIIGRELTKIHEEVLDLSAEEALQHFQLHPPRGEFVIIIAANYN